MGSDGPSGKALCLPGAKQTPASLRGLGEGLLLRLRVRPLLWSRTPPWTGHCGSGLAGASLQGWRAGGPGAAWVLGKGLLHLYVQSGGGLREALPPALACPCLLAAPGRGKVQREEGQAAASAFLSWQRVSVPRGTPAPCWGWGGGLSRVSSQPRLQAPAGEGWGLSRGGKAGDPGREEEGGQVQQEDWACGGTLRRSLAVGLRGVSLQGWWPWVGCC